MTDYEQWLAKVRAAIDQKGEAGAPGGIARAAKLSPERRCEIAAPDQAARTRPEGGGQRDTESMKTETACHLWMTPNSSDC